MKRAFFFLDEIQSVDGWEKWLRTQLERPRGNHFVVTGSNAQLLSSVLTGSPPHHRAVPSGHEGISPDQALARAWKNYLADGGFPEPLMLDDGDRLRQQYFADIVERDIRERVGARSAGSIRQVVQLAFESVGAELGLRRLAGAAGIAVETVAGYLDACEAACLLFSVPYFAYSERERATRNKKYYPIDTGLRRMVVTRAGADRGKLSELAVYLELRRHHPSVSYWRGRGEVDFVVEGPAGVIPVQVSWEAPTERHHRALEEFYETFPQANEAVFVGPEEFQQGLVGEIGL